MERVTAWWDGGCPFITMDVRIKARRFSVCSLRLGGEREFVQYIVSRGMEVDHDNQL